MTIIRQGEVRMQPIASIPSFPTKAVPAKGGVIIVGQSESHHHHVLDAEGVTVLERTDEMPEGMKVLYAIVNAPTKLRQTAGNPHGDHVIEPGTYEITIKREFDPFMEQARAVQD